MGVYQILGSEREYLGGECQPRTTYVEIGTGLERHKDA